MAESTSDVPHLEEGATVDVADVLTWVRALPGAVVTTVEEGSEAPPSAWGDSFVTYDPDGTLDQSRWQPFATVVTSDHPGFDTTSRLDRPGVLRVNVAAGRTLFTELLGYPPVETGQRDPTVRTHPAEETPCPIVPVVLS